MATNIELKNTIDLAVTNKSTANSISPQDVGQNMKAIVDFVVQEVESVSEGTNGADGADGLPGPTGPRGPQGDPGPVGPAGLTWKGQWVSGESYLEDDAVGHNGASWFCIADTSGTTPPNADVSSWALLASQGAQGNQGPQGEPGVQGIQGLSGEAILTNDTISGGALNTPVPIITDVITANPTDNSNVYYSLPDYTDDQTKIGKRIIIRNPSIYGVQIKGSANTTIYTNTSALANGNESFENPLLLRSRRTTELIYLGNTNGYERWSSHLFFSPRNMTNGHFQTKSLALINSANVNSDISVVTPTNETDNYMRLFTSYTLVGESVIVINASQTIDIRLLGTPLYHHALLGLNSNADPYIIPAGKTVRFTKGPSDYYFIAEVISYQ